MGQWSAWYAHSRWRKFRRVYLAQHPLCVECERQGKTTPATDVDHIEPHKGDRAKFWAGPFQALCAECHSRKTASEEGKRVKPAVGVDGSPEGWA